jgi:hypothetical protein
MFLFACRLIDGVVYLIQESTAEMLFGGIFEIFLDF